ncbi:MAG: single-stranded-DNA-specific exonuclease RecJ [Clostridia bacterium]|nr:single-stranded-DNA-specific exonuclease RecJ [Clostridia bacterium]
MKIIYEKPLSAEQTLRVNTIAKECGVTFNTARLLYYRSVDTAIKAKRFLSPGKDGFNNPFKLYNMKEAVERISLAKSRGENVLIFGDYDADGVCATTVLYYCLKEYGFNSIRIYVPEREDGYGLNLHTVEKLNSEKNIDLLITVDCGISDYDKIEELNKKGIDVIVTDHHEPPEILPSCIKVNPKLLNQEYPFSGLCGAGVAYKLGYALIGEKADKYLDFVALATVADSMDLIDENRDIVFEGLKLFNSPKTLRAPFKELLSDTNKNITAQTLAYSIAPRINAGGRMGDANTALKLFTSVNPADVFDAAVKLNEYNIARQAECDNIYREAKKKIIKHALYKKDVILVKDKSWQAGFIGIVAAKLVEDYARPVIVFAGHDDFLKGSARSVDEVNIHDAIASVKDLLIGFGGHSQAAGVSVSYENFATLDKALNAYVKNNYGKIDSTKKLYAEWEIDQEISIEFAREIEMLEPFGVGNRRPVFTTTVSGRIDAMPLREGSPHYSFKTPAIEMLEFNGEKDAFLLTLPVEKTVVFEINVSTFKNRESIKGFPKHVNLNYGDFSCLKNHIFINELKKLSENGNNYKETTADNIPLGTGVGTLYAVNDVENLNIYPTLKNLPIYLFTPESKNPIDCIVVSPKQIPEEYDRVVYLDSPLKVLSSRAEAIVVKDVCGYKFLQDLSVERSDFARIFNKLLLLNNKPFKDVYDFTERFNNGENAYLFAFAVEVFLELGIFKIKNGLFTHNETVKNALTNSALYSKIVVLKGRYV